MFEKINRIKSILSNIRGLESRIYSTIDKPELFLRDYSGKSKGDLAVDLGCGDIPQNPFNCKQVHGLDIRNPLSHDNVTIIDLFNDSLPFGSETVDAITAHDFIEHVPRYNQSKNNGETRFPFVLLMDDIFRVLKPGGLFYSRTPAFPKPQVFQDPTHVNIITEETFPKYFCSHQWGGVVNKPWGSYYGFKGEFTLVDQKWCHHWLLTLLRKPER